LHGVSRMGRLRAPSTLLTQRSTPCGARSRVLVALAALQILALPPGIAAVCALPEPECIDFIVRSTLRRNSTPLRRSAHSRFGADHGCAR
ncbi:MAG: hypothetical protein U1F07_08820, partial [Rubrivivax sp.]